MAGTGDWNANCVMHGPAGGATRSRAFADTQSKVVMNALAKQPFADFTAEQKRYEITLRVRAVAAATSTRGAASSIYDQQVV